MGQHKIGVISDLHIGYLDEPMLDDLEDVVEQIDGNEIELLLVLGDVLQEGHDVPGHVLGNVVDVFDDVGAEVVYQAGNHDRLDMSRDNFYDIVGNEPRVTKHVGDTTYIIVDTAYGAGLPHTGYFSEHDMDYVERSVGAGSTVIASHFPLLYTTSYRDSQYFDRYPEGVFALGKHRIEMARSKGELSVQGILGAHMHLTENRIWEDTSLDIAGYIQAPFVDFENDAVNEMGNYSQIPADPLGWCLEDG